MVCRLRKVKYLIETLGILPKEILCISFTNDATKSLKDKLEILYEDKYIIAVSKPHNLLTIGTQKEKDKTLYRKVSEYVKKQHKSNKIFIVHRLDKDTSGIILFAKDEKTEAEPAFAN